MQQTNTLHYYLPMLWHRHIEIALCSHEHRDLDTANQCLQAKKQSFDELLQDPNLSKQQIKRYKDTIFLVRQVVLKKSWVVANQNNCYLNGEVKPHWQNKFIDLQYLPLVSVAPDSMPVDEMITKIDCYHDQPRRRSKNRPKVEQVASLNDFLLIKIPDYLKTLASEL